MTVSVFAFVASENTYPIVLTLNAESWDED